MYFWLITVYPQMLLYHSLCSIRIFQCISISIISFFELLLSYILFLHMFQNLVFISPTSSQLSFIFIFNFCISCDFYFFVLIQIFIIYYPPVWRISFSSSCGSGLLAMNFSQFCLSEKVYFTVIFERFFSLGKKFCYMYFSLSMLQMSLQASSMCSFWQTFSVLFRHIFCPFF